MSKQQLWRGQAQRLKLAEQVAQELARLAVADVADLVGKDGTIKDSKNLSRDSTAAIAEISETRTNGAVTKAIKLHRSPRN